MHGNFHDLSGKIFGKWKVLKRGPNFKNTRMVQFLCRCKCGKEKLVTASSLRRGRSTGCQGCPIKDENRKYYRKNSSLNTDIDYKDSTNHPNFDDLSGKRFGKWLVLERGPNLKNTRIVQFLCRCECGKEKFVIANIMRRGDSKGCLDCHLKTHVTHGNTHKRSFRIYKMMINRCHNKKNVAYHYYGGRGIFVCDRWREDYRNFFEDMGEPKNNLTLDRINNDLGYSKENCRWATYKEQSENKRPVSKRKLCYADAKDIRLLKDKLSVRELQSKYNVTRMCITNVLNEKSWRTDIHENER